MTATSEILGDPEELGYRHDEDSPKCVWHDVRELKRRIVRFGLSSNV